MYSPNGLGFSLPRQITPPSWLRSLIAQHVGAAVKGTTVSIPTDGGTVSFDLSDPKQWAAIANMIRGIRISRQPAGGGPGDGAPVAAAAGLGLGAVALIIGGLYLFSRRSRA